MTRTRSGPGSFESVTVAASGVTLAALKRRYADSDSEAGLSRRPRLSVPATAAAGVTDSDRPTAATWQLRVTARVTVGVLPAWLVVTE
jgi:hypothetical protein